MTGISISMEVKAFLAVVIRFTGSQELLNFDVSLGITYEKPSSLSK